MKIDGNDIRSCYGLRQLLSERFDQNMQEDIVQSFGVNALTYGFVRDFRKSKDMLPALDFWEDIDTPYGHIDVRVSPLAVRKLDLPRGIHDSMAPTGTVVFRVNAIAKNKSFQHVECKTQVAAGNMVIYILHEMAQFAAEVAERAYFKLKDHDEAIRHKKKNVEEKERTKKCYETTKKKR